MSARARLLTAAACAAALACSGPVEPRVHEIVPGAWQRVAVAPFDASPSFGRGIEASRQPAAEATPPEAIPRGPLPEAVPGRPAPDLATPQREGDDPSDPEAGAEAAARVTRLVSEAFSAEGFDVIPASELAHAYAAAGEPLPQGDFAALAGRAAREFGATALLVGKVTRWRERQGGELGATHPASVGFQVEVRSAPSGRLLWSTQFDHTQKPLSADLFRASRYPGGGSRWLSAAELARWGAEQVAHQAREGQ